MKTKAVKITDTEFMASYIEHNRNGRAAIQAIAPNMPNNVAYNKAARMLQKATVRALLKRHDIKLEDLVDKAITKVDKLLDSESEQVVTINAWKTIEQIQGKAVQKIEQDITSAGQQLLPDQKVNIQFATWLKEQTKQLD